jgi:hypothetical protein
VICNANAFLAKAFEELVHRFFPNIKLRRLSALQKKRLLDYWTKFKSLGGTMKDYCQGIVSRQIKPLLKVLIFTSHQYEFGASAVNSKFSW